MSANDLRDLKGSGLGVNFSNPNLTKPDGGLIPQASRLNFNLPLKTSQITARINNIRREDGKFSVQRKSCFGRQHRANHRRSQPKRADGDMPDPSTIF